ncbi:MAG: DUF4111 domain-containing protein [candidate division Zixibacteria bacterium]|nr:DUF4111 domain-containing protein [candidate division Zixibacteria bacterium]
MIKDNSKFNTVFPELDAVLREWVSRVREVLHDNFIGAYLQGSAAVGGFDKDSDVDFIVVINRELSDTQINKLQALHARLFTLASEWARHLEGSYFPAAVLKDYDQKGSDLWYLEHGVSVLVKSNHCNTVVVRWILREKGVILAGPEPSTLMDPIPVEVLRRDMLTAINFWGTEILRNPQQYNNRFYQSYIVLNFSRMLHDFYTGTAGSKPAGAEWAGNYLDKAWSGLIDRAWNGRPNPAVSVRQPADCTDFKMTLVFVGEVMRAANDLATAEGFLRGGTDRHP